METLLAPPPLMPPKKAMTWTEFQDMDIPEGDTSIYELIHGNIVKRASPNTPHQEVSFKISGFLFIYNQQKKQAVFLPLLTMSISMSSRRACSPTCFSCRMSGISSFTPAMA